MNILKGCGDFDVYHLEKCNSWLLLLQVLSFLFWIYIWSVQILCEIHCWNIISISKNMLDSSNYEVIELNISVPKSSVFALTAQVVLIRCPKIPCKACLWSGINLLIFDLIYFQLTSDIIDLMCPPADQISRQTAKSP